MGGTLFLFTLVLFPLLLGVLSHLSSFLHQNIKRLHNLSTIHHNHHRQPLFLQHNSSPRTFCFHHCNSRVRESMDDKREEQKAMRRKISLQNMDGGDDGDAAAAQKLSSQMRPTITSPPSSPLKKSSSSRSNCLCSPTTHVGSFRCRLHRYAPTKPNMRRGHSVGSNLSDLANKLSSSSSLSSSSNPTLSTSSLQTSASSSQMQ